MSLLRISSHISLRHFTVLGVGGGVQVKRGLREFIAIGAECLLSPHLISTNWSVFYFFARVLGLIREFA